MGAPDLFLDPNIKIWVLVPILSVMIMVGLARHYATIMLQPTPPVPDAKERKEQAYLRYAASLRQNYFNLSGAEFSRRAGSLVPAMRQGLYLADPDARPTPAMPSLTDPKGAEMLIGGLRNQVLTYVPQTLMMQWVSAFFGGYVVMKLPFPLTTRFKAMVQANIPTDELDVRWVSSISWFILLVLGLGGVYSIILGRDNQATQSAASQMQMQMPSPPNVDKRKLFEDEADALELVRHKSIFPGIAERVLAQ